MKLMCWKQTKRYISAKSLACSRLRDSWAAELRKREDESKTGGNWERRGGGACNLFLRDGPLEKLWGDGNFRATGIFSVYPLIGQIWQIVSTLSKRVVQKDGMRRPRAWNRGIHENFCVERMLTRFPAHRSAEEGTEDLPCELGARKKCFCSPADRLRSCLLTKWQ